MSGLTIFERHNYFYTKKDAPSKNDPAFYCDGSNHSVVISYTVKGYGKKAEFDIYCDGEMRAIDPSTGKEYYTYSDFLDSGIDTDEKLSDITDNLVWQNNAWFDVYDAENGDHLDSVFFDLREARSLVQELFIGRHGNELSAEDVICLCGCVEV